MSDLKKIDVHTDVGDTINRLTNEVHKHKVLFNAKDFKVLHTPSGVHLSLNPMVKANPSAVHYKGEFDPTASYDLYDVIRVLTGSIYRITGSQIHPAIGTFECSVPIPAWGFTSSLNNNEVRQAGVTYHPVSPEPSTLANPWASGSGAIGRYWEQIGGNGGTGATMALYTFSASYGDYFLAKDASNNGVQIARIPETRCSTTTKIIYGNTFTYTYPHNPVNTNTVATHSLAFVFRQSSNTTNGNVYESITPAYSVGDNVLAVAGVTTNVFSVGADGTTPTGSAITIQEVTNRAWAVNADQNWGIT